ncbi:MAG: hypothetical protein NTW50_02770, partial [Candidatus Berkelbacteria bacterium]|nr:hypothetical protein [Candidatus Berkelbacteria bacterium]
MRRLRDLFIAMSRKWQSYRRGGHFAVKPVSRAKKATPFHSWKRRIIVLSTTTVILLAAGFWFLSSYTNIFAGNVIWTGNGTDSLWSNGANWQGGVVPGSSDIAVFNSGSKSATINSDVNVLGISISGDGGQIIVDSVSLHTITIGTAGYSQSSGGFFGGNNTGTTITINGNFQITGNDSVLFVAPARLNVSGNFVETGGAFTANNGTVSLTGAINSTQVVYGNTRTGVVTFNNLEIINNAPRTVNFQSGFYFYVNGNWTVNGTATSGNITLGSNDGYRWYINPPNSANDYSNWNIDYVSVSHASSSIYYYYPALVKPAHFDPASLSGGNSGWFPTITSYCVPVYDASYHCNTSVSGGSFADDGYGTYTFAPGSNINLTITASAGYSLRYLYIDSTTTNVAYTTTTSSSLSNIQDNHTVRAYAVSGYGITSSAGPNGNITASQLVTPNGSATFTITPNIGYIISDLQIDGVSAPLPDPQPTTYPYTFTNVTTSHTISVTFTGTTCNWLNTTGDGKWSTATNWSDSTLPNSKCDAQFDFHGDSNSQVDSSFHIKSLLVKGGYSHTLSVNSALVADGDFSQEEFLATTNLGADLSIGGNFKLLYGNFFANNYTVNIGGLLDLEPYSTFNKGTSTVNLNGNGGTVGTITTSGKQFYRLNVNGGSAGTLVNSGVIYNNGGYTIYAITTGPDGKVYVSG